MEFLKDLSLLLIDDEPEILESYEEVLNSYFKKVYTAKNGLEALKIYEKNLIHVIFVDYEMPVLDGFDFIQRVRKTDRDIHITIISNHDDVKKLQKCIPLRLSGYLTKPLAYKDLREHLDEISKSLEETINVQYKITPLHILDPSSFILYLNNEAHSLTKMEFTFLETLVKNQGRVVSKEVLEHELEEFISNENAIKNVVYRLKKKYSIDTIKNIKDVGYMLLEA